MLFSHLSYLGRPLNFAGDFEIIQIIYLFKFFGEGSKKLLFLSSITSERPLTRNRYNHKSSKIFLYFPQYHVFITKDLLICSSGDQKRFHIRSNCILYFVYV